MFIHRVSVLIYLVVLTGMISSTVAAENVFTFQASERYAPSMGIVVGPKESEEKFVALPATAGKFHWCLVDLKRDFSPGRYKIEFSLYAPGEGSPAVALYAAGAGDRHEQISRIGSVAPGTTGGGGGYFYATRPFSALAIKKMADGDKPSVAVGQITLTDTGLREYPRLAGYRRLVRYPAPWGLDSPVIREKLNQAKEEAAEHFDVTLAELADVEKWLDLRSEAADVCCRADYVLRAATLKKIAAEEQVRAVMREEKALRNALALNQPSEAAVVLNRLRQSVDGLRMTLEKSLGGSIPPETGTDIFTWLKAWELVGAEGGFEHSEPTPFQTGTMAVGEPITNTSTWTTNTYRAAKITARYSVLTPLRTFDVKQGPLRFDFSGLGYQPASDFEKTRAKGYWTLSSPRDVILFVINRRCKDVSWKNDVLSVEFSDGGAVGYVRLPSATLKRKNLVQTLATFYQRLLLNQPVECVQVQKRNQIEQTFEYVERSCDWPLQPLSIAPVPQLAMLSREPSSKHHVQISQPLSRAPDGWAYVNQSDTLRYDIPEIQRWNEMGINHYENCGSLKDYQELSTQGCQYIRLICGADGSFLTEQNREKVKERLQMNLQWIRETGMKVSIDAHGGGWLPEGLGGEKGYSDPKVLEAFLRNWKMILEWCRPYQDVIAWYDLQNEPGIYYERESVKPYAEFMRKAVKELRPLAGDTPIMVECVNMANPVGLNFWEDLGDDNIVVGFHDYWPHMFTHQRAVEPGDMSMPATFFPSWMPLISWTTPSWNNEGRWYYWDRWKCDSICLPVYRLIITKGLRFDCGEYGLTGCAGDSSPRGGVLWMRQAMERYRRLGVSHAVYGVAGGYTWHIPAFRNEILRLWNQWRKEEIKQAAVK
ncbi:MAG: cellulase family glycosylhydrolase [Phycisphaerae bacterium]|nr:cellulase family glycosylhydrolase [Phycisphaerae bacterium]